MNIHDAALEAKETGRGFTRVSFGENAPYFIATNTTDGIIVSDNTKKLVARWQPTLEDIVADDWYVYG